MRRLRSPLSECRALQTTVLSSPKFSFQRSLCPLLSKGQSVQSRLKKEAFRFDWNKISLFKLEILVVEENDESKIVFKRLYDLDMALSYSQRQHARSTLAEQLRRDEVFSNPFKREKEKACWWDDFY